MMPPEVEIPLIGVAAQSWMDHPSFSEYLAAHVGEQEKLLLLVAPVHVELRSQPDELKPDVEFSAGALVTSRALHVLTLDGFFRKHCVAQCTFQFDEDASLEIEALGLSGPEYRSFDISWDDRWTDIDGEERTLTSACRLIGNLEELEPMWTILRAQITRARQRRQRKRKSQVESIMKRARADEPISPEEFSLLDAAANSEYWNEILPRRQEQKREIGEIRQRAHEGLRLTDEQSSRLQMLDPDLHATWLERATALARELGVRPTSTLIRSPRDAEENAARWMMYWGFHDARITPEGADEGIDVNSSEAIAQVKAHMVPVGRPDIQNLAGVAAVEQKTALFFALSGFTQQALEWADRAGVALFTFDLVGDPEPINAAALEVTGLHA